MKAVVDNASGPTGAVGIFIGLMPDTPSEILIFFSTALVLCQLAHWTYRFLKWFKK